MITVIMISVTSLHFYLLKVDVYIPAVIIS